MRHIAWERVSRQKRDAVKLEFEEGTPLRSICEINQRPVVLAFLKNGAELLKITPSSGLATKPAMTT